jgi:hypothetical protein
MDEIEQEQQPLSGDVRRTPAVRTSNADACDEMQDRREKPP